jgi:serine/threonine-protein kinase
LQAALKVLERAQALNPKHFVPYFVRGKVLYSLALRKRDRGENPEPELRRSVEVNRQGIAINGAIPHLHNGAGLALQQLAQCAWELGQDPFPLLAQAQEAYRKAIEVAPNQVLGHLNLGELLVWKARWESGLKALQTLQEAESILRKAATAFPSNKGLLANLGWVCAVRIDRTPRDGGDPSSTIQRGEFQLAKVLAVAPQDRDALYYLGELRSAAAKWKTLHHIAQRNDFTSAAHPFGLALEVSGNSPEIQLALARLCLAQAQWERNTRQDPGPSLARGQSRVSHLLKSQPRWAAAIAVSAGLNLEEAEGLPTGERTLKAAEAQQAFTEAFTLNKNLIADWKPLAERAQQLAKSAP